jgi:GYF domain 2
MSAQWFCRIMGEEWGPMSAMELCAVARRGRLTRDDVVRNGFDGDWVRAETVCGLFDGLASSVTSSQIRVAMGWRLPRPASRSIKNISTRYWVRHGATTAGPFSKRYLLRLAAMGRLKPEYLINSDGNRWFRADDIEMLRLKEQAWAQ